MIWREGSLEVAKRSPLSYIKPVLAATHVYRPLPHNSPEQPCVIQLNLS